MATRPRGTRPHGRSRELSTQASGPTSLSRAVADAVAGAAPGLRVSIDTAIAPDTALVADRIGGLAPQFRATAGRVVEAGMGRGRPGTWTGTWIAAGSMGWQVVTAEWDATGPHRWVTSVPVRAGGRP
jgi:hypothetical protein